MKNKALLVIILIGFVGCSFLANKLYAWKANVTPHEARVPTQFYAGMDKFISNVSWMTLVQWEADENNHKLTSEQADKLYGKLNTLTNLDPLFADAYLDGALTLAPYKSAQALQLLDKAQRMNVGWKAPFYAG